MMMVVSVLAFFDIKPPKDAQGQEIEIGPMDVASLLILCVLSSRERVVLT